MTKMFGRTDTEEIVALRRCNEELRKTVQRLTALHEAVKAENRKLREGGLWKK